MKKIIYFIYAAFGHRNNDVSKSGLQNYIMQSAAIPGKNILNSLGLLLYAENSILDKKRKAMQFFSFIGKTNSYAFPLTN